MKLFSLRSKGWYWLLFFALSIGFIALVGGLELNNPKKHDFRGECRLCHSEVPSAGTPYQQVILTDQVDKLCARCHNIVKRTSHPTGMKPQAPIPLERYLDNQGRLTCVTCHSVHKEENVSFSERELKGLLRGHAQGRSFCFICHNKEVLGADWRHELVVSYAHSPGELIQSEKGSLLDKFSVECLSCHDGVISKMTSVTIREGEFRHGIGLSHPVGVEYPRAVNNDFVAAGALPEEIKLFSGKVGCLSCHNPYAGEKSLPVMDNTRSALCLACHKK